MRKFFLTNIFLFLTIALNAQWTQINFPLTNEQINAIVYVDNYILTGTAYEDGVIYRTSDFGNSWETATSGLPATEVRKLFTYPEEQNIIVYAATDSGIFSSTNFGTEWIDLSAQLSDKNILTLYRTDDLIFAGADTKNYRSTDKGISWNEITIGNSNQKTIDFFRAGNNVFACLLGNGNIIYKSEDFGSTWVPSDSGTNGFSYSGASLEMVNNNLFYAAYSTLFRSTDEGVGWQGTGGGWGTYPATDLKSYGSYLFISTLISGMYLLHADSTLSVNISDNIPYPQNIPSFDINSDIIVTAVYNYGNSTSSIWTRPVNDITSVESSVINLPKDFVLEQNYPNPFNPTTKISWHSAVSSWQTLKIYDVLGNEVATLVNEVKPAGNYEIDLNASELSSGIYLYQLKAGEYLETKKMMLIK